MGTYLIAEGFSPTTIVGTPAGTDVPAGGFTVHGDRLADFQMTFLNQITLYKNLELSFLFHWKQGGDNINLSAFLWDAGGTTPNWDGDDDGDGVPNGRDRQAEWGEGNAGVYVQDASYLKLREIGLYYTLPQTLTSRVFNGLVERVKVGFSGNNLFLWTDYESYDPEVSNFGSRPITSNIEVTPFPTSRRMFFHLNIEF